MCKLIVGINKEKGNKEFEKYVRAQHADMLSEKDGAGGLVIDFDGNVRIFRSLTDYARVFEDTFSELENARLVALHTRTGTSGKKDEQNVHFFEHDNHIFAHNGFVPHYHTSQNSFHGVSGFGYLYNHERKETSSYEIPDLSSLTGYDGPQNEEERELLLEFKEECTGCLTAKAGICRTHKQKLADFREQVKPVAQATILRSESKSEPKKEQPKEDMCDSFLFLKNVQKPVTTEVLDEFIEATRFNGLGFMLNRETLEAFLMVRKDAKCQTDKKTFAVFYSYEPEDEVEVIDEQDCFGVSLVTGKTIKLKLPVKTIFEGTFKLKF